MRVDRVVDFDFEPECAVLDFWDINRKLFFEVHFYCKYNGDFADWHNDKGDVSKLQVIKRKNKPRVDYYENRREFEQERINWLEEADHATHFENIGIDSLYYKMGLLHTIITSIF